MLIHVISYHQPFPVLLTLKMLKSVPWFPKPLCFTVKLQNKQVLSLHIHTFLSGHEFTIIPVVLKSLRVATFKSNYVKKKKRQCVLSHIIYVFPNNVLQFLNWNVWFSSFMAATLHLPSYRSPERSSSGSLQLWAAALSLQLQMFNSFPLDAHSRAEKEKKRHCWVPCRMATRWAVSKPARTSKALTHLLQMAAPDHREPIVAVVQDWGAAPTHGSWLLSPGD